MKYLKWILLIMIFTNSWAGAQEFTLYTHQTTNISNDHIKTIFVDHNNIKWIGTEGGLVAFDGVDWFQQPLHHKVLDIAAYSGFATNLLWIATDHGIFLIRVNEPNAIEILNEYQTENSDILSDYCKTISVDHNGDSWIGSDIGLSFLKDMNFITLTAEDSKLSNSVINDIKSRSDGYQYIATQGGGITRLTYDDVDGITAASVIDTEWSLLPSDTVNTVCFDSDNTSWYGTNYGVSSQIGENTKRNWTTFTTLDGLSNNSVLTILEDIEKNLWVGTANGFSRYNRDKWTSWNTKAQSAGDSVFAIAQDQDESFWIGTNEGLLHFRPSETSIDDAPHSIRAQEFNLYNYPNPFNPRTVISYQLSVISEVQLNVYNAAGQHVSNLVSAKQSAGSYQVEFDGAGLPSGVYYYRLTRKGFIEIKKMLLMK